MKNNWTFYYWTTDGCYHVYSKRENILKPERTKTWKDLEKLLSRDDVKEVGYERDK